MPEQQPAAVPPKKGVEPPLLPNFLNYQVAGQIRSDHRETLRGSGTPTLTEGFSGIRNRDVFILNDGTDATADGALQIS